MSDYYNGEKWRPIVGYEDRYEVSDLGWVRSLRRPGMLTPWAFSNGYRAVTLWDGTRYRRHSIHRLVLAAFVGPCPPGQEVRHINGDPADNHLENLAYGTRAENNADTVRHGRHHRASATHCPNGHEYLPETHRRSPKGVRVCRICERATQRRKAARKRARSAA